MVSVSEDWSVSYKSSVVGDDWGGSVSVGDVWGVFVFTGTGSGNGVVGSVGGLGVLDLSGVYWYSTGIDGGQVLGSIGSIGDWGGVRGNATLDVMVGDAAEGLVVGGDVVGGGSGNLWGVKWDAIGGDSGVDRAGWVGMMSMGNDWSVSYKSTMGDDWGGVSVMGDVRSVLVFTSAASGNGIMGSMGGFGVLHLSGVYWNATGVDGWQMDAMACVGEWGDVSSGGYGQRGGEKNQELHVDDV